MVLSVLPGGVCKMNIIVNQSKFERGQHAVSSGNGGGLAYFSHFINKPAIGREVEKALKRTKCRTAFLLAMVGDEVLLLAAAGITFWDAFELELPTPTQIRMAAEPFEFPDMATMKEFEADALVHIRPGWRYWVNAPVPFDQGADSDASVSLICLDVAPRLDRPASLPALRRIAKNIGEIMSLVTDALPKTVPVRDFTQNREQALLRDSSHDLGEQFESRLINQNQTIGLQSPDHPLGKFLIDTLINRQRLRSRKTVHYLALRCWAKPIKQYQINALRALKAAPPRSFIEEIAQEMALAVKAVHGLPTGAIVVPVPCGHSGPNCFSTKLARALAKQLGFEYREAFACQTLAGSSHPKTNVRRPKMKLIEEISANVILVDDVATSGAHLEEAARLLSATSQSVWPVVWISD
jgi:predicted amidophosphoribosyltransferase